MAKQQTVVKDYHGHGVIRKLQNSQNYFMRFRIKSQKGWTAWRKTSTANFSDAERIAANEYSKIKDRIAGASENSVNLNSIYDDYTFVGVAKRWLAEYKACAEIGAKPTGSTKKASLKQVSDHTKHVNRYIEEFFGHKHKKIHISRVTKEILLEYMQWRCSYYTEGPGKDIEYINTVRNGKPYKHRVKHKKMDLPSGSMGIIEAIFEIAMRNGIITPVQKPIVPKPEKNFKDKKRDRRPAFSSEHWKILVEGFDNYIDAAPRNKEKRARQNLRYYTLILAEMGIRPGTEHQQIQWRHVSFQTEEETGTEVALVTIHENTKSGSRVVYVAPHGASLLRELKEWSAFSSPSDYIFANPVNGDPVLRFDGSFSKFLDSLDLTHATSGKKHVPYSLRSTYATRSREAGLPDNIIAMNMGHEDVKMVQQVYGQDEIISHGSTIVRADRKRNPQAHKNLANDLIIKSIVSASDITIFSDMNDAASLDLINVPSSGLTSNSRQVTITKS